MILLVFFLTVADLGVEDPGPGPSTTPVEVVGVRTFSDEVEGVKPAAPFSGIDGSCAGVGAFFVEASFFPFFVEAFFVEESWNVEAFFGFVFSTQGVLFLSLLRIKQHVRQYPRWEAQRAIAIPTPNPENRIAPTCGEIFLLWFPILGGSSGTSPQRRETKANGSWGTKPTFHNLA